MSEVDIFVVYDEIKYTKKGWINRNRFLRNGSDVTFSIALERPPIVRSSMRDAYLKVLIVES